MKWLAQYSRFLIGLLLILSGLIKANDPTGFSYKLEEYFTVFSEDLKAVQDTLAVRIDDSLILSRSLVTNDSSVTMAFQCGNWETTLTGDSLNPDTLLKSKFYLLFNNQVIYQTDISSDTTFNCQLFTGNAPLINEKIDIQSGINLSKERKIPVVKLIKKDSYWAATFRNMKKYALIFAILISVIEILLGFALLIGFNPLLIGSLVLSMMLFFTFLTWYSATYNKVTDCGCFGDALKLTPHHSFYKDVVLTILSLLFLLGHRKIKPLFSIFFSINFLAFISIFATSFAIYCRYYLPVYNFLPFKPGNNVKELMKIPSGERLNDHVVITYLYKNEQGELKEVIYDSDKNSFTPKLDYSEWSYYSIKNEKIIEKAYQPPIHDFHMFDAQGEMDFVDSFFNSGDQKFLLVVRKLERIHPRTWQKIKKLALEIQQNEIPFIALTSASPADAEKLRHDLQLSFEFYYGDETNLKTIIRSNPGLLYLRDSSVIQNTWPYTRLPSVRKINKLLKKE